MGVKAYLVHVSRTLVKIGERRHVGDDGQDAGRVELDVALPPSALLALERAELLELVVDARNLHVHLLKCADVVDLAVLEEPDRPHHPRPTGEEEETRELTSLGERDVPDLKVDGHVVTTLGLPESEGERHALAQRGRGEPDDASVELNVEVGPTVDGR